MKTKNHWPKSEAFLGLIFKKHGNASCFFFGVQSAGENFGPPPRDWSIPVKKENPTPFPGAWAGRVGTRLALGVRPGLLAGRAGRRGHGGGARGRRQHLCQPRVPQHVRDGGAGGWQPWQPWGLPDLPALETHGCVRRGWGPPRKSRLERRSPKKKQ